MRVHGDLLVLRVRRREDVLRRIREPAEEAHERVTVDRVVDGLPHRELVERRLPRIDEEVVRVRRRVDLQLARILGLDVGQPVGRDRVEVVVGGVVQRLLQRGRVVLDNRADDLVGVPIRDIRRRLEVRVPDDDEALVRLEALDHVRPGRRRRARGLILRRRARGHGGGELGPEDVGEVTLRRLELDRDVAGRVVGRDPGDVTGLRLRELVCADDVREEADARRVELVVTLDRRAEVARLDRRAVRVLQAFEELELVRQAVGRDVRQRLDERRHQRGAVGPGDVLVAEERRVHVPEDRPAVHGVGETRVEEVDAGAPRHAQDRERLCLDGARASARGRSGASVRALAPAAAATCCNEGEPCCDRRDTRDRRPPVPPSHNRSFAVTWRPCGPRQPFIHT